jgi:catalase
MHYAVFLAGLIGTANAACPYMSGDLPDSSDLRRRDDADASVATEDFLSQFYLNDKDVFMTSDVGGPIEDQNSLSAGERGPTLLEDFIFRQKIQRFDHERVINSLQTQSPSLAHWRVIGPRTRRPRARCRRPWRIHILWRLV